MEGGSCLWPVLDTSRGTDEFDEFECRDKSRGDVWGSSATKGGTCPWPLLDTSRGTDEFDEFERRDKSRGDSSGSRLPREGTRVSKLGDTDDSTELEPEKFGPRGSSIFDGDLDDGEWGVVCEDVPLAGENTNILVHLSSMSSLAYWSSVVLFRHLLTRYLKRALGVAPIGSSGFLSIKKENVC